MTDAFTVIRGLIAPYSSAREEDIKRGDLLDTDLGLDSLDKVELVMGVEEQFDVDINDDQMESIRSVADLVDFCEKKKG